MGGIPFRGLSSTLSIVRLSSDVICWQSHPRNWLATVHELGDGYELFLSSSGRVKMVGTFFGWCLVHPRLPTTISAAINRVPTHLARSLFHPYLDIICRSEQSNCTRSSIENVINFYMRSEAVRLLHMGPHDDQVFYTTETLLRKNITRYSL